MKCFQGFKEKEGEGLKTIGIVGSRRRDSEKDFEKVEQAFLGVVESGDRVCSGLCPKGADRFAVILAERYNLKTLWFPADWRKYGRGAGFIRNTDIANSSDVLIACVAKDRKGGTEDTIRKFIRFGKGDKLVLV